MATYRRHRGGGIAAVPLIGFIIVRLAVLGWLGLVIGVLAGAAAGVGVWRYIRGVRIEVTATAIAYVGFLRTRRWHRSELERLLVVDRLVTSGIDPGHQWLVALAAGGRRMFQLTSSVWADDDRDRLAGTLGSVERWPGTVTAAQLHARHPHALNIAQRHPWLTGLGISVTIIGATTLVVFLLVAS